MPSVETSQMVQADDPDDPIATRNLNSLNAAYETASVLTASNPPLVGSGAVSVVPDLMEVYENMTKSSTPQDVVGGSSSQTNASKPDETSYAGPYYTKQQQNTQHLQWMQNGAAMEFTVPPIPEEALAALSDPPQLINSTSTATELATTSPTTSSNTSSASAVTARRSNKRPQASISKDSDTNSNSNAASPANTQNDSESDETDNGRNSRRKTKSDKEKNDGRWSKRFTWPENLHRDFCSAIFDVGLKHASPTQVMEFMPKHTDITSERIKSHLQKYRLHRSKNKQEFMSSFDATLKNLKLNGIDPTVKSLAGGEMAAYLAYSECTDQKGGKLNSNKHTNEEPNPKAAGAAKEDKKLAVADQPMQGCLIIPRLSEVEKTSPLGMSLGYLMGLFFSLKQQLMTQRAAQAGHVHFAPSTMSLHPPAITALEAFAKPGTMTTTVGINFDMKVKGLGQASLTLPDGATAAQRSNLEESTLMKREMDNQMAFQNKMRALKQQELNKYRTTSSESETVRHPADDHHHHAGADDRSHHLPDLAPQHHSLSHNMSHSHPPQHSQYQHDGHHHYSTNDASVDYQQQHHHHQPHDDPASDHFHQDDHSDHDGGSSGGGRTRGMSLGGQHDDFWNNTDMMDDQLFEFLLNN
ncbi:hypothetical protein MPSEU_000235100 [Mayamaea pseudoterrestris]|nr:hypothetical protein MPSEU_000235100 [Mayamaea pseudoterrestris]